MSKSRLHELYQKEMRYELQKDLGLKNIMQVPKIDKIVINIGVKAADDSSKSLKMAAEGLKKITGQAPIVTHARKSIAGFKIREGMQLGVKVTLRKDQMYNFLDKLINLALPRVRDFHGVKSNFDGHGNYNLGIKEWTIFPELDLGYAEKQFGMNVTVHITGNQDQYGMALLKRFKMPFRK